MNLTPLFEKQRALDAHILETHPELKGVDLLPEKILALQVELGELAQEWRGFKFWSNDREPRTNVIVDDFKPGWHGPSQRLANRVLEEYADCLHFALSIGLELEVDENSLEEDVGISYTRDVTKQFIRTIEYANKLHGRRANEIDWLVLMANFNGLGKVLGFSWEQIEHAYMEKNAENHKRQEAGY